MSADPVIALSDPSLLDVVRAGVRRAGGDVTLLTVPSADAEALRAALVGAHDVVIALCVAPAMPAVLEAVRAAGGRPIPVLALREDAAGPEVPASARAWLSDPALHDLEIPVPTMPDDAIRTILWDQLRSLRVEERHHLVEVDGRPALEEVGKPEATTAAEGWARLAAGAAGVLAGRLAASNRRWRAQLEA